MVSRRQFVQFGLAASGTVVATTVGVRALSSATPACVECTPVPPPPTNPIRALGPLSSTADKHGLRLPEGFSSRVIATAGIKPCADSATYWHHRPDGGACFSMPDNGWAYVSNSEVGKNLGGVQSLRFSPQGEIIDCYSILSGTNDNCAGGATPWGTWLSGEETPRTGRVWECDPSGKTQPVAHSNMGIFCHEAVAVHESTKSLYLTEDRPDGGFYRYLPRAYPDLSDGELQIAELQLVNANEWRVIWHPVPNPTPMYPEDNNIGDTATRHQIENSYSFNGGEGLCLHDDFAYFSTKGDNRIWEFDIAKQSVRIIYDAKQHPSPILTGVDNLLACHAGDLLVAEDGGNMELILVRQSGDIEPVLQVTGQDHSEITGPAFSPDYSRLIFSSQRADGHNGMVGVTYEVTGPWV